MNELPLRDIHLPEPVSWWPPAPGWWLLAALAVALAALWLVRRRRLRVRRGALRLLGRIERRHRRDGDPRALVRSVSTLLRRVCLSYWPRKRVAALTGPRWRDALLRLVPREGAFSEPVLAQIVRAPYDPSMPVQPDALLRETRRWLRALPPRTEGME